MITQEEVDQIRSVANRINCQDKAAAIVVVNDDGTSLMMGGDDKELKHLKERVAHWLSLI